MPEEAQRNRAKLCTMPEMSSKSKENIFALLRLEGAITAYKRTGIPEMREQGTQAGGAAWLPLLFLLRSHEEGGILYAAWSEFSVVL